MRVVGQYRLANISMLKEHEQISESSFNELLEQVRKSRKVRPILVEKHAFVILDGHHRFNVMKRLGFTKIPAVLVDYQGIEVMSWREDVVVTKEEVIRRAKEGKLFPPKTSRHIYQAEIEMVDIDSLA